MPEIKPISIPGIYRKFIPYFRRNLPDTNAHVLDVGAGHGAFSKEIHELGYQVTACDFAPEIFYYDKIVCHRADLTQSLPFEDNSFDAIVAMEVMEHILDHEVFFREAHRVLKPGGKLFISTPNILSFKSRVRFLFTGFFYSFQPIDWPNSDGLQHVASLTLDQYNYVAARHNFGDVQVEFDKKQSSSQWLMFLYPIAKLYSRLKQVKPIHNTKRLLVGRVLFLKYTAQGD